MSIYSQSEQGPNALNGIGNMSDGSGTINPAALNSGGMSFIANPCSQHIHLLDYNHQRAYHAGSLYSARSRDLHTDC